MMENTMKEDQGPGPVSKRHRSKYFLNSRFIILLLFLAACSSQGSIPSPTGEPLSGTFRFPAAWTVTSTGMPASALAATSTRPATVPSPTPGAISTQKPTMTNTGLPTRKARPTILPTPTRGLPPSLTPGPIEECPPPTYARVNIHFEELISDYGPQILEYFRALGDRADLEEQLERLGRYRERTVNNETGEKEKVFIPNIALFTEADVTGDQVKETIITLKQMVYYGARTDTAVFVVGCRNHQYQLLAGGENFYLPEIEEEGGGIADIRDLNADGLQEIIFSMIFHTGSAHGDMEYSYNVFEWDGYRFRTLLEQSQENLPAEWIDSINGPLELRDIDSNGTAELLLPQWAFPICGCGPVRMAKKIYMWDGEYYRYMWTDPGAPIYRFQAAFDGDYYSLFSLYDKSEASYRKAIQDPSLKPYEFNEYECVDRENWEPYDPNTIIAYTRFRLVELLAFLNLISEANVELAQLAGDFPEGAQGHQYVLLADLFWNAYQPGKDVTAACAAVRDEAVKQSRIIFDPIYYGWGNPNPTPDTICPFHTDTEGE
jgi:hypothetical protein